MSEDEPGQNTPQAGKIQREIFRKSIHIVGFVVPFMAIAFGITVAALFVITLSALYCISEYLRLKGRNFPILTALTSLAMRTSHSGEARDRFVKAPLYFAGGILASLIVFADPFNYVAIAVVTLGDGTAAIVGRLYGRTKIPYSQKTVEGTLAGLVFAFAGSLLFVSPMIALAAASVGMLVELLSWRISDNLTVPLLAGLTAVVVVTITN